MTTKDLQSTLAALKRKFHILVAIFACLHLLGGNYGIFQALAWSKMLVEYSQQNGLIEGTIRTFDGEHPCSMCKGIANAKKQDAERPENEKVVVQQLLLKDFPACRTLITAASPAVRDIEVLLSPDLVVWETLPGARPPLPPPRSRA